MRNGVTCALALALVGCNASTDKFFCGDPGCDFSDEEWASLTALADLPPPPPNPSNKYVGNSSAEILGQKLFHDARFSGVSLQTDSLKRPVPLARAPKGQPSGLACVSCHDANHGGVDTSSVPGNVSIGAGWSDTNAPSSFNTPYYGLPFWNGRVDSLWAQAAAAVEGPLLNGSRLQVAWVLAAFYADDYNAVFTDTPLPFTASKADLQAVQAMVETNGQCKLEMGACPVAKGCREIKDDAGTATGCWPVHPLVGKPGSKPGCQPGDATEPAGDAYDCMPKDEQVAITRVLVNFAKALEAYETRLVTSDPMRPAPFDRWIHDVPVHGAASTEISELAKRGAKLFVGRAACVDCHNTPFFSDAYYQNVGKPQVGYYNAGVPQTGPGVPTESDCPAGSACDCTVLSKNCLPWGALDGFAKLSKSGFRRDSMWSDDSTDKSRTYYATVDLTKVPKAAWRTPTLRNVALTAPYMHNGSLATLEAVIEHYDVGGSSQVPGAPNARIKPLFLTADDKAALLAFLQTLTSPPLPASLTTPPTLP